MMVISARPTAPYTFNAVGDSITYGSGVTYGYAALVQQAITSNKAFTPNGMIRGIDGDGFNYIYAGQTLNLTQDAVTTIDPIRDVTRRDYLVIFAGTNDIWLGGSSAAQTYAYFQTFIDARIASGWVEGDIFVCTMLPRQTLSETIRTAYNSAIVGKAKAGGGTYNYTAIRLDLDASVGVAGQQNDTTYYQSGAVHPNQAGHQIIANLVYAAINFP